MPDDRGVPITGAGIVSSIGHDIASVTASLRDAVCGIEAVPERKRLGFRSSLSGVIKDFRLRYPLSKKWRKTLPDYGLWAWSAIQEALECARITIESAGDRTRIGIVLGNDSSVVAGVRQVELLKAHKNSKWIGSGYIFQILTSTLTLNFSSLLNIQGVSLTVSAACASGAVAIGLAADLIRRGEMDIVICGGAQEISWESMCSFDALGAFSTREREPWAASRPFDMERDGLVPSGGAAALVLESIHSQQRRGVSALGYVQGFAQASDGYHVSIPTGEGLYRSMRQAISSAGIQPEDVDLVMAHAASTRVGDEAEAKAMVDLFGMDEGDQVGPVVCAVKGLTGHEFWMAGASQAVYALLMAKEGFVAGHPNLEEADGHGRYLKIPRDYIPLEPRYILCNASGFGGTNASLLISTDYES